MIPLRFFHCQVRAFDFNAYPMHLALPSKSGDEDIERFIMGAPPPKPTKNDVDWFLYYLQDYYRWIHRLGSRHLFVVGSMVVASAFGVGSTVAARAFVVGSMAVASAFGVGSTAVVVRAFGVGSMVVASAFGVGSTVVARAFGVGSMAVASAFVEDS